MKKKTGWKKRGTKLLGYYPNKGAEISDDFQYSFRRIFISVFLTFEAAYSISKVKFCKVFGA